MLNGHYSIDLAEDRERWRAVINFTVNLQVSLNVANFLTGWAPASFYEGPCFIVN